MPLSDQSGEMPLTTVKDVEQGTYTAERAERLRSGDSQRTRCVLDAHVASFAARVPALQQHSGTGGQKTRGSLPVWLDADGCIRIAINVRDPQFAHDADQIILKPEELFLGLATAFERKP